MTTQRRSIKVFLCHDSSDKPRVRALYRRLVTDGVDAWLDEEKLLPGQDWHAEITKAVRAANVVVICLSNHSITKEGYVQREMKFALDVAEEKPEDSIFIIPARLEECEVPDRMKRWQWVDLFSEGGYEWLMKALQARAKSIHASPVKTTKQKKPLKQERVLEAVIENRVAVGKPASLFVWIKRLGSKSIISVVPSIDEDVVLDVDNVKSKGLEIEFPIENGRVLSAAISLKLTAREFSPAVQQKKINIPPEGDSEVCTFIVTPKNAGTLFLSLEVLKDGVSLATRTLRTTAMETEKKESNPIVLVSIPIVVFVRPPTETPHAPPEAHERPRVPFPIRLIFTLVGLTLLVFFTQAYLSNRALFTCTPPTASAIGISVVLWLLVSLGWCYLEEPIKDLIDRVPPGQQDFKVLLAKIIVRVTDIFLLGQLSKTLLLMILIVSVVGTLILWGLNQNGILYFSSSEETPQIVGFSSISSNETQTLSPESTLELERGQQYLVRANHLPNDITCNWSSGSRGALPMEPGCATRYAVPLIAGEIDTLSVQVQSACKTKSVFASLNVKILEP